LYAISTDTPYVTIFYLPNPRIYWVKKKWWYAPYRKTPQWRHCHTQHHHNINADYTTNSSKNKAENTIISSMYIHHNFSDNNRIFILLHNPVHHITQTPTNFINRHLWCFSCGKEVNDPIYGILHMVKRWMIPTMQHDNKIAYEMEIKLGIYFLVAQDSELIEDRSSLVLA